MSSRRLRYPTDTAAARHEMLLILFGRVKNRNIGQTVKLKASEYVPNILFSTQQTKIKQLRGNQILLLH